MTFVYFPIVGTQHAARGLDFVNSPVGMPFLLARDRGNPHDANAVAAWSPSIMDTHHVGYVSRHFAADCCAFIDARGGGPMWATLDFNEDGCPLARIGVDNQP